MFMTADQFAASNKANLETVKGLSTKSFAGFEKMAELN
ncbi:MAG: phasin family protein, partial [Rhodoferax sp.]|nr:phasin family protein [Rhodoferax sp.]